MSTRWGKFSLILISLLFSFSKDLKAEEVSEIIFGQFPAKKDLVVSNVLKTYPNYANREIESVAIYISPTELKTSQVILKIGNQTQTLTLESYRPDDVNEFKFLTFSLPGTLKLKQKDIQNLSFSFNTEVAVTHVKVNYKGDLTSDIEGSQFNVQLDRLEKLSKQNLYAEVNNRQEDEITRFVAAVELAEYPSLRAALILLERRNYDGVWVDWDLNAQALKSLKIVIGKLIAKFGEENTLYVLERLYSEDEQFDVRHLVIDTIAEFKTSAGIMFLIKNHTYSSTPAGNYNSGILDKIYQKPDLAFYVDRYRPQLVDFFKTGAGLPVNDATFIWAKERACSIIAVGPVSGLFDLLWIESKRGDYTLSGKCSYALESIIRNRSATVTIEAAAYQDEMIKIILDTHTPQRYYFSHMAGARRIAALMLGKFQSQKARAALTKALTIEDLEDSVKEAIVEALSWYK